jgi:SAM-dependent methyltransferase
VTSLAVSLKSQRPTSSATGSADLAVFLRCPACGSTLGALPRTEPSSAPPLILCPACGFCVACEQGIWLALPTERLRYYDHFMREYEFVRAAEGRGSGSDAFYIGLPFHDLTGRNIWQWKIRARSFRFFERKILSEFSRGASLRILDLGAGNGWLSYRLSRLGHQPVAVDLLTNSLDGLGAATHYRCVLPHLFPRFQAEMDRLPFADRQFDCAVFNASFHYSQNYFATFDEAVRCVKPGGNIIILDSPWYRSSSAGQQMVVERRQSFLKQFGFASDSLQSAEFLTDADLASLQTQFPILWTIHRPWYGLRWALRPVLAKVKRKREPAQFRIYVAEVCS